MVSVTLFQSERRSTVSVNQLPFIGWEEKSVTSVSSVFDTSQPAIYTQLTSIYAWRDSSSPWKGTIPIAGSSVILFHALTAWHSDPYIMRILPPRWGQFYLNAYAPVQESSDDSLLTDPICPLEVMKRTSLPSLMSKTHVSCRPVHYKNMASSVSRSQILHVQIATFQSVI